MACGGDVRTSVGGVVVGGMMLLVAWCVHGCFDCCRAAAGTQAGGAFDSACRTHLGGGDRRGWWPMLQSHRARQRQPGRDTCLTCIAPWFTLDLGSHVHAVFAKE